MLTVFYYVGLTIWIGFGSYMFYMTVRDDIRNEKERKEKKR